MAKRDQQCLPQVKFEITYDLLCENLEYSQYIYDDFVVT